MVLTDHKSLEAWTREVLDTPSGPVGRRARWHEYFSRFDMSVEYVPGKSNEVADSLSRWAYPASQALHETSVHGTIEDDDEVSEMLQAEKEEERQCLPVFVLHPSTGR